MRSANAADASTIVNLASATDRFTLSQYTSGIELSELSYWIADDRSLVLVGEVDGAVVGYALGHFVSPKWMFFDQIVIHHAYRRAGYGQALYAELKSVARARGTELIQGWIKEEGENTVEYWKTQGFEVGELCYWVEDWLDD